MGFIRRVSSPVVLGAGGTLRLAGLGGDDDQLSQVHFAPGAGELTAAEQEKVIKLGTALAERPSLRLEVRGSFNADSDAPVLRAAKLVALANDHARRDPAKYAASPGSAGFAPRLLRDLYSEVAGPAALQALEQRCQVPKTGRHGKPHPKDTVLDELTFLAELRKELTAAQPVDAAELRRLAQERSVSVKNVLVQAGTVEESRIFLLEVQENAAIDDGQVRVELQLGS